jgi:hypothetical protein
MYPISYQYIQFTLLHGIRLGSVRVFSSQPFSPAAAGGSLPQQPPPALLPPGGSAFPPGGGLPAFFYLHPASRTPTPSAFNLQAAADARRAFPCAGRPRRAAPARAHVTLRGATTASGPGAGARSPARGDHGAGWLDGGHGARGQRPHGLGAGPRLLHGHGPIRRLPDGAWPAPPRDGRLPPHRRCSPALLAGSATGGPSPGRGAGASSRLVDPWIRRRRGLPQRARFSPWRAGAAPLFSPLPFPSCRPGPPLSASPSPSLAARMLPHWPWARPSPSPASQAAATGSACPCVCVARSASMQARAGVLSLVSITSTNSTK